MRSALEIATELAERLNAQELALLLELTLTMSAGTSARNPVESPEDRSALERRRALDRVRKQANRAAVSAEMSANLSADASADKPKISVILSKEEVGLQKEEVEKKKVKTREKGSRLLKGAKLSDDGRVFAVSAGMSADKVDAEWDEFVDYWIGVPGARGCKLDWPATWRNRVRDQVGKFYGRNHHGNRTNNAGGNTAAGRATAREADFLAAMGKGALNVLGKGISTGPEREISGNPDASDCSAA